MKKVFRILLKVIKNKFIVSILVFIIWVTFFDRNDIISKYNSHLTLLELKKEKQFYIESISKDKNQIHLLKTDVKNLEKYAREEYLMKQDNEDLFIIINKNDSVQKAF